jgi:hypothetical protein
MMRRNYDYNHQSQSHEPLEGDKAVGVWETRVSSFFVFYFICSKPKVPIGLHNNNIQTMMKLQPSP